MKYKSMRFLTTGVAAATMLLAYSSAFAAHPGGDVQLMSGTLEFPVPVTLADQAYSPKATCARACHIDDGDDVDFVGHDYGSGNRTAVKTQGVLNSAGTEVVWQSYEVHGFDHGAVVGRHSQQGRNEDYSIAMKTTFGDAFFTSAPGMFGKY